MFYQHTNFPHFTCDTKTGKNSTSKWQTIPFFSLPGDGWSVEVWVYLCEERTVRRLRDEAEAVGEEENTKCDRQRPIEGSLFQPEWPSPGSNWITSVYIMHSLLEVKMTFGIGLGMCENPFIFILQLCWIFDRSAFWSAFIIGMNALYISK